MQKQSAPIDDMLTDDQLSAARNALDRGDRAEAERLWDKARLSNPLRVRGSEQALKVALELGRFDDAAEFMTAGQRASPRNPLFLEGLAMIAQTRGDYADGLLRWEQFRRQFPMRSEGYHQAAACLKLLNRVDDAEALLNRGLRKFPQDFLIHVERARLSEFKRDWPEAAKRWNVVYERHTSCMGGLGVAVALREMGKFDEAETLLRALRARWPIDPHPSIALARIAHARGDLDEAITRWAFVRQRYPTMLYGHIDSARTLIAAGRADEAEAVLLDAIDRFKDETLPSVEYARLAHNRHDWAEADRRWSALRARFPDQPEGYDFGSQALAGIDRHDEAEQLKAAWKSRRS